MGDLPFGSYEASTEQAVRSGIRLLKEGNMDAIKLEGTPTSCSESTLAQLCDARVSRQAILTDRAQASCQL